MRSRTSSKPSFELHKSLGTRDITSRNGALTSSPSQLNINFFGNLTSCSPLPIALSASSDQPEFGRNVMRKHECVAPPRDANQAPKVASTLDCKRALASFAAISSSALGGLVAVVVVLADRASTVFLVHHAVPSCAIALPFARSCARLATVLTKYTPRVRIHHVVVTSCFVLHNAHAARCGVGSKSRSQAAVDDARARTSRRSRILVHRKTKWRRKVI